MRGARCDSHPAGCSYGTLPTPEPRLDSTALDNPSHRAAKSIWYWHTNKEDMLCLLQRCNREGTEDLIKTWVSNIQSTKIPQWTYISVQTFLKTWQWEMLQGTFQNCNTWCLKHYSGCWLGPTCKVCVQYKLNPLSFVEHLATLVFWALH